MSGVLKVQFFLPKFLAACTVLGVYCAMAQWPEVCLCLVLEDLSDHTVYMYILSGVYCATAQWFEVCLCVCCRFEPLPAELPW